MVELAGMHVFGQRPVEVLCGNRVHEPRTGGTNGFHKCELPLFHNPSEKCTSGSGA